MHALHPVFLAAAGVAALGFMLSWLLQERPLRAAAAATQGLEDALAAPKGADSLAEIERALAKCTTREERMRFHARVAQRAEVPLSPGATWALVRIDEHGLAGARQMAVDQGVPPERVEAVIAELRSGELLAGDDGPPAVTPSGHAFTARVVHARRQLLDEALANPAAARPAELDELLRRLSVELVGERP